MVKYCILVLSALIHITVTANEEHNGNNSFVRCFFFVYLLCVSHSLQWHSHMGFSFIGSDEILAELTIPLFEKKRALPGGRRISKYNLLK